MIPWKARRTMCWQCSEHRRREWPRPGHTYFSSADRLGKRRPHARPLFSSSDYRAELVNNAGRSWTCSRDGRSRPMMSWQRQFMWAETAAANVTARFTGHSQPLSSTHLHRMHNSKCDDARRLDRGRRSAAKEGRGAGLRASHTRKEPSRCMG